MRKLVNCFNRKLVGIYSKAADIRLLNKSIQEFLEKDLKPHCEVRAYTNGVLTIEVDSQWATQLRFAMPELRSRLRMEAKFYGLRSIKSKTRRAPKNNSASTKTKQKPLPSLTEQSVQALTAASECEDDLRVKQAFARLADTIKKRSEN